MSTVKIVRRKSDNAVTHIFGQSESVALGENGLICKNFRAPFILSSDYEIELVPEPPFIFVGMALSYDDDWAILDQEAYDAAISEANSVDVAAMRTLVGQRNRAVLAASQISALEHRRDALLAAGDSSGAKVISRRLSKLKRG